MCAPAHLTASISFFMMKKHVREKREAGGYPSFDSTKILISKFRWILKSSDSYHITRAYMKQCMSIDIELSPEANIHARLNPE